MTPHHGHCDLQTELAQGQFCENITHNIKHIYTKTCIIEWKKNCCAFSSPISIHVPESYLKLEGTK